jgi:hypothetical protein
MTLPASGAISMSNINTELGRTSSASINLNDSTVRGLAGKPSGAISLSDFYGKSGIITNGLIIQLDAANTASYPGTGTSWNDLSGNGYNGTLVNGVGYTTNNGGVLVFDGVNDYVSVNVNSWIRTLSSAYTFNSFLCYNGSSAGGAPYSLMTFPNDSNNNDGFWQHLNLGNWLWRTEDNIAGEYGGNVEAPSTFTNGNWYHVATVVKTNSLSFYRNGALVANISTNFNWNYLRTDQTAYVYIGTGYGELYAMNGSIGNFSMYNRELSAAEIQQNFNAIRGRYGI